MNFKPQPSNDRIVRHNLFCLLVIFLALGSAQATFPGENGRIAFGRYDPAIGWFRLYTANPDGTDVQPLTHVASSFSDWSADGKRIAFDFFDDDGNEQIATINPDGSHMKAITSGPGIHEVPSWSPDGSQIAFDYSPSTGGTDFFTSLYVMNADGSNPHLVTPTGDTFDVEPRFSPDGKQITFVRIRRDLVGEDGFQPEAVFVMHADGTSVRQLTPWGSTEHPTWTPDSRWIVFDYDVGFPDQDHPRVLSTIFRIRPDGSKLEVLYNGRNRKGVHKPIFSPDGKKILFGLATGDIWVVNLDGSHATNLTNTPDLDENYPSWGVKPSGTQ
jgi:Tol biopolymer transport system component